MIKIEIKNNLSKFELDLLYREERVDKVELNRIIVSNLILGYCEGDSLVFEVNNGSKYGVKVDVTKYEEFDYEFTIKEIVFIHDNDIY